MRHNIISISCVAASALLAVLGIPGWWIFFIAGMLFISIYYPEEEE